MSYVNFKKLADRRMQKRVDTQLRPSSVATWTQTISVAFEEAANRLGAKRKREESFAPNGNTTPSGAVVRMRQLEHILTSLAHSIKNEPSDEALEQVIEAFAEDKDKFRTMLEDFLPEDFDTIMDMLHRANATAMKWTQYGKPMDGNPAPTPPVEETEVEF